MNDNTATPETTPDSPPKKPGIINWKIVGIAALLIAGYYGYGACRPHPLEGEAAAAFSLPLLDGDVFHLDAHLGKQPVLLDFWAVWCPPCREGLPKIAEIATQYAHTDLVVCAVNLGDAPDTVRSFLAARDIALPTALDEGGEVADLYGITGIPMLVFIDRNGIIRHVHLGSMSSRALERQLQRLL